MSNITVRDPFHDMRSVVRHAFDEPFFRRAWSGDLSPALRRRNGHSSHALALDVYEDDGVLHVEAPLPGFTKDDVKVTLEKGKLTIRAEHETKTESNSTDTDIDIDIDTDVDVGTDGSSPNGRRYFMRERRSGAVARSLLIGDTWDADTVHGALEDGVLKLTVAKSLEAQPRTVEIA
jgi:HSP20 family protein